MLDVGPSAFEGYIELLRQRASPGLSGVLIQDGAIAWERGLGFANVESSVPARPDTPYLVGDLTEAFTSVLVLQCAEQRRMNLTDPVRTYGGEVPERATIRQVLSHTSGRLQVRRRTVRAAHAGGRGLCASALPQGRRAADDRSSRDGEVGPRPRFARPGAVPADMLDKAYLDHYRRILENLAIPYKVDKNRHPTRTELAPEGINAATGLVSTVRDLAQFDFALDDGTLLRDDTLAAAWSPAVTRAAAPRQPVLDGSSRTTAARRSSGNTAWWPTPTPR